MRPVDLARILTNIEGDLPQIIFVVYDPGEDTTTIGPWKVELVTVNVNQTFVRLVRNPSTLEKTLSFLERLVRTLAKRR